MTDLITLVKNKDVILFDMDGTLVNTEPLHAKAAIKVLAELGTHADFSSTLDQFYGMTDYIVLKTVCPHLSENEIKKAIERKNFHLIRIFDELTKKEKTPLVTPGLFPFLEYLKKEKKKCAVVSASEDVVVAQTLKCFEIENFVEIQMGRDQTILTKPHPDPYIEAIKRLQSSPERALIFEDSPTGITSALGSKAEVIRITAFLHKKSTQTIQGNFLELSNFEIK